MQAIHFAAVVPLLLLAPLACQSTGTDPVEVRGVWIPNTDTTFFDSRANVAAGCEALATAGVNVIFPVVWSKGYTLFHSEVVGELIGAAVDPRYAGRDPLAEVVFEAHRHGIEVVPWFEYGFAAGHVRFPGRVLERRPDWAALGADGEPVVKNGFQWMNAFDPKVQEFVTAMVLEVARNYDVDGVQGDDRLPALAVEGGYNHAVAAAWRKAHGSAPPADCRESGWVRWRADRLTGYLAKLRAAVKAVDPGLAFTMAPGAPNWAYTEYLQDQRTWVERGLVDSLHPQAYARSLAGYEKMVDDILAIEWIGRRRDLLAPGVLISIADWFADGELAVGAVAAGRRRKLAGEVWFFHEGLVRKDGAVGRGLAAGPYARRA
ncbi:MAG: family 10 glycosylhydrolase, partial [Planctomycetes bacterium]|nr:family 10 glycosylhydrolase [Planctomycetota bacterium]